MTEQSTPTTQHTASAHTNSLDTETAASVPRIRTYAADMSSAIKARGETLASIVNKEKTTPKRAQATPPQRRTWSLRTVSIAVASSTFVLAGIGLFAALFFFSPNTQQGIVSGSIIFPNETRTITLSATTSLSEQLADLRQQEALTLGEVLRVIVMHDERELFGEELARALGVSETLARHVTEVMVGIHAFDRNQPFIMMRVSTYDRAFGALLEWESNVGRDLGPFFGPVGNLHDTPPRLIFADEVVQNLDIRRSQSLWPILYTFPNQELLIITTNEFTLRELIARLTSTFRF